MNEAEPVISNDTITAALQALDIEGDIWAEACNLRARRHGKKNTGRNMDNATLDRLAGEGRGGSG